MLTLPNTRTGRKAVAAAGTAERLVSENTICRRITVQAMVDNTGYIAIGDSNANADVAGNNERGIILFAGNSFTFHVEDVYQLFADASVSGEGVTFVYEF